MIVAPVGTLVRSGRMRHGNTVVPAQIFIKPGGADFPARLLRRNRQRPHAAMSEDDIAVPVREQHTALIGEQRRELAGQKKQIYELLVLPPREFLVESGLVVGRGD